MNEEISPYDVIPCEECKHSVHKSCAFRKDCEKEIASGLGLTNFQEKEK